MKPPDTNVRTLALCVFDSISSSWENENVGTFSIQKEEMEAKGSRQSGTCLGSESFL